MKYIVSKNKNDNPDFFNINDAIIKSKDLDEIIIKSGYYEEYITISKNIKLIGDGKIKIFYNDPIDNLIFINESCELINLTIETNNKLAIHIYSCFDVLLKNCDIKSNGTSISIVGAGDFIISKCNINSLDYSIQYNNFFDNIGHIKNSILNSINESNILLTKKGILKISDSVIKSDKKHNIIMRDETQVFLQNTKLNSFDSNIKLRENALKKNINLINTKTTVN